MNRTYLVNDSEVDETVNEIIDLRNDPEGDEFEVHIICILNKLFEFVNRNI